MSVEKKKILSFQVFNDQRNQNMVFTIRMILNIINF